MKRRADESTAPRPRRVDGKVIVTRQQAIAKGLKRYFTGRPCANGHVAERLVTNSQCPRCVSERHRKRYQGDPEYRARQLECYRKRYQDDPEFRARTLERTREYLRKRRQDPEFLARELELRRNSRRERYQKDSEYRARTLELNRKRELALKAKKTSTARAKPDRGAAVRSP
jgi:hypothetical protein